MSDKPISQRRLLSIAKRMLIDGECFYAKDSPRMTWKEYLALNALGFRAQSENPHPPECRMFYMMREFEEQNTALYETLCKQFNRGA